MKELVVISGKGGTGKTSLVASFAALADQVVLADCDVDAADLHLILNPVVLRREDYSGGKRACVDVTRCIGCGKCEELCRFGAVSMVDVADKEQNRVCKISPIACEGCGVCAWFCPAGAITMEPAINGEWYVSQTRMGPMVHARLGVAEENSGKLVSTVRQAARDLAKDRGFETILIDGSPGIGCPVIASITGADLAVIVVEPTVSGLHDLRRVADLIKHFGIPGMVCVNKWDLNPQVADDIEQFAAQIGLLSAGRVRYDRAVTDAQVARKTVVEHTTDGIAKEIHEVWQSVQRALYPAAETDRS
jgi:MinD superfamily P-loop ATPase